MVLLNKPNKIMKKLLLSLALFSMFTVIALPPPLPPRHNDFGILTTPIELDPNAVLGFYFVDNQSQCDDINLEYWLTGTVTNGGATYTIPIIPTGANGSLSIGDVNNAFQIANGGIPTGGVTITHASINIIMGGVTIGSVYPNAPATFYTGLPYPCDCIRIAFNGVNEVVITRGNCGIGK